MGTKLLKLECPTFQKGRTIELDKITKTRIGKYATDKTTLFKNSPFLWLVNLTNNTANEGV